MSYVFLRRACAIGAGAVVVGLALAATAAGQSPSPDGWYHASRLGGSTAFYAPPLRSAAGLKVMLAKKGIVDDIRLVLREAGTPDTTDGVLAALASTNASVKGGSCDMATPADGTMVECDFQPGSTLLWMAQRPNARKGIRTPARLERIRWNGKQPFKAFLFRVTSNYKVYTYVLPLACANLSLMSVTEIEGAPVDVTADRSCDPATGAMRATITASSKDLERVSRVSVALGGQPVGEITGPSWTFVASKPGTYTFDATDKQGRPYPMVRRSLVLEPCPPPPAPKTIVGPTCNVELSYTPVKRAYELRVDATRSTTGADGVFPTVTVEVRDGSGAVVGQQLVMDGRRVGTIVVPRPGSYRAVATVTTSPAIEVGTNRYEGSATCEATTTIEQPAGGASVFFDVLGGKERRVRPIEDTNLEFAQCSPLLGLKLGIAQRFPSNWELAGAVGAAISLASGDDKVREHALFVDAEINRHLSGGAFFGTGLSLWDLTRSDTMTPAWLLHMGIPLSKTSRYPIYFIGEGRVFLDHADDVKSNYLLWGGVRVNLKSR